VESGNYLELQQQQVLVSQSRAMSKTIAAYILKFTLTRGNLLQFTVQKVQLELLSQLEI
jgi:hypothetical protein